MTRRLRGPAADDVRDIDRDLVIGRARADVEIDDPEVSRRHAAIRPVARGVEVEDLGSRNGTLVDGERITGTVTVTQTAALQVGATVLEVEVDLPPRGTGIPAAQDVTVQRPIARPDVTVVRSAASAPPAGPTPPAGSPPSSPPAEPRPPEPAAPAARRRRRSGRAAAVGAAGVVLGATLAVAVMVLLDDDKAGKPAAQVASRCASRFPPVIRDGLPQPKMAFSRNGVLDTTLRMAPARVTVGAKSYDTGMKYDGQMPGRLLVICPGDRVTLRLQNGLPLPSNLHVHGLHVSPVGNSDNVFINVKPLARQVYQYEIPPDHHAGYFWYHPHLHPIVERQVAGGLAGGIVIQGSLDDLLPEVPQRFIVIQGGNRRKPPSAGGAPGGAAPGGAAPGGAAPGGAAPGGAAPGGAAPGGAAPGGGPPPSAGRPPPPIGVPELLVNGVQNPTLRIRPGEVQRWRILNAASNRLMRLGMPGVTFQVMAHDGITLRFMRPQRRLLISPGSRVEVLVRGGRPGVYTLSALPFHQCLKGCNPFAGPTTGVTTPKEDLLTMISGGAPANDRLPSGPIGNPPDLRQRAVDVRRTVLFSQQPALRGPPDFQIDRKVFDHNRVDITMKLGAVEEWTLENPTNGPASEWHTFHIHQNSFQVISINGKRLDYIDWQDNVTLGPGDTVVIRINPLDFTGKFVFHCHVIFHEDHGMMGVAQVLSNPTAGQVNASRIMYMKPPPEPVQRADARTPDDRLRRFVLYCRTLLRKAA